MKNILFPCVCTCTVAVFGIAAMTISADAADQDFLVTSSYVQSVTQNTLNTAMEMLADETFSPVYLYASQSLDAVVDDYDADAIYAAVLDATLHAYYQPALSSDYYLCTDNTLAVNFGESFSLDYGAVTVTSGSLIDLTAGGEITAGTALVKGHQYLPAEQNAVLTSTSQSTVIAATGTPTLTSAMPIFYGAYADALNLLGLFAGGTDGYELGRSSTRAEALVMLIRLIGQEQTALTQTNTHPFTDVLDWADAYAGYGYANGLTSGISATEYGASSTVRLQDYMTFLLRSLGYDDANGDFDWATADATAVQVGILSETDRQRILLNGLRRDDIVMASYNTLTLRTTAGVTLAQQLIEQGVFTADDWTTAQILVATAD